MCLYVIGLFVVFSKNTIAGERDKPLMTQILTTFSEIWRCVFNNFFHQADRQKMFLPVWEVAVPETVPSQLELKPVFKLLRKFRLIWPKKNFRFKIKGSFKCFNNNFQEEHDQIVNQFSTGGACLVIHLNQHDTYILYTADLHLSHNSFPASLLHPNSSL